MTEAGQPVEQPQRSVETTLALHGILSALSDKMTEGDHTFYNGKFETGLKHSAVFPQSTCQGQMVITHMDNLVEYADLVCSEGCTYEVEVAEMRDPSKTWKEQRDFFMIDFEEVGFISGEFTNSADGKGRYISSPQILSPRIGTPGLTDADIQDLK